MKSQASESADDGEFGVEPVATKLMESGVFDDAGFKAGMGDGASDENQAYALRFAYSITSQAVAQIAAPARLGPVDKSFDQAVDRWASGALRLEGEALGLAIADLKEGLGRAVPAWRGSAPGDILMSVKKAIARVVAENKSFADDKLSALIDALSDVDRFSSTPRGRGAKGSRAKARAEPMTMERARAITLKVQLEAAVDAASSASGKPRL